MRRMQLSMPRPRTSTFMKRKTSISSLSHSMTLAVFHGRGCGRNEIIQPVPRHHETAEMSAELAWKTDRVVREIDRESQARVVKIEVGRACGLLLDAFIGPAPDLTAEGACHILRQAERLADIADVAA